MDWIGNAPAVIAGLALGLAAAVWLARSVYAGMSILLLTYLCDEWLAGKPLSLGILVYPLDLVLGWLLLAGLIRHLQGLSPPRGHRFFPLLLLGLFVFSLFCGISLYGAKQAGVECRPTFYFLAGLLYFSTFGWNLRRQRAVITFWLATSGLLVLLAMLRWEFGAELLRTGTGDVGFRVLNAGETMFLSVGFFASFLLNLSRRGPTWQRLVFYVLGPAILLLQHRTVWAVMLTGLLWLALHRTSMLKAALRTAAVTVPVVIGLAMFGAIDEMKASVEASAADRGTLLWRVDGWRQLIWENPGRTLSSDLWGQPYGTGFARSFGPVLVDSAPHNYYVEIFLRLGAAGVILLLLLYLGGIHRLRHAAKNGGAYPDHRFWSAVLVLQLVFFITYSAEYPLALVTAVACNLLLLGHPGGRATLPPSPARV